jgi:hypothetical protein
MSEVRPWDWTTWGPSFWYGAVATKYSCRVGPSLVQAMLGDTRKAMVQAVEASLKRIGTDRVGPSSANNHGAMNVSFRSQNVPPCDFSSRACMPRRSGAIRQGPLFPTRIMDGCGRGHPDF